MGQKSLIAEVAMSRNLLGRLLVASAALALAACAGGGGSDIAPTPIPIPPSPPPPPPTPSTLTVSSTIFPNISTNTNFATLGLEATGAAPNPTSSALVRDGFSVRFDAASKTYIIGLPLSIQGALGSDDSVSIAKPSDIQLAYTTFGSIASGYYTTTFGHFAFGLATPASGIPVTGTATYDANVLGSTLDSYYRANQLGGSNVVGNISGAATLQFDFGAGSLAGHFDPILAYNDEMTAPASTKTINLGSYSFVNTVYGTGKTNFSGNLSISGSSNPGTFDGQFTGPAAQELMARWTAPYLNPSTQQWSQMFGVWVGKKH